jgi:hypothetical protein
MPQCIPTQHKNKEKKENLENSVDEGSMGFIIIIGFVQSFLECE